MNFKDLTIEQLAAIISKKSEEYGLDVILVGGACVSIYSHNDYQSYDLDFITYENMKIISKALMELNFEKKGKHFINNESPFFIEFINPPIMIGEESIKEFEIHKTPLGKIKMLKPTDCIKDRLAAFYHGEDFQSLEQAVMVYKQSKKINIDEIKKWSKKEGHIEKFNIFLKKIISKKK